MQVKAQHCCTAEGNHWAGSSAGNLYQGSLYDRRSGFGATPIEAGHRRGWVVQVRLDHSLKAFPFILWKAEEWAKLPHWSQELDRLCTSSLADSFALARGYFHQQPVKEKRRPASLTSFCLKASEVETACFPSKVSCNLARVVSWHHPSALLIVPWPRISWRRLQRPLLMALKSWKCSARLIWSCWTWNFMMKGDLAYLVFFQGLLSVKVLLYRIFADLRFCGH